MSSLISSYFKRTETTDYSPPVPPKTRQSHWCDLQAVKKTANVSAKIFFGLIVLASAALIAFKNYQCISDISTLSENFGCELTLAAGGLLFCLASCFMVMCCMRRSQYPHRRAHQGNYLRTYNQYRNITLANGEELFVKGYFTRCFRSLEEQGLLAEWLKVRNFQNQNLAIEPIRKSIEKGNCFGYSMVLLDLMSSNYNSSSEKLYKLLKVRKGDIYFFQLWQKVLTDLLNGNSTLKDLAQKPMIDYINEVNEKQAMPKIVDDSKKLLPTFQSFFDEDIIFLKWMEKCKALSFDLNNAFFFKSGGINTSSSSETVADFFKQTVENLSKAIQNQEFVSFNFDQGKNAIVPADYTLTGIVSLQQMQQNKDSAHALFFQCTDHFRFHDSGGDLPGFFEFPDHSSFFKALVQHVHSWKQFKNQELSIFLMAIPKKRNQQIEITVSE